MESSATPPTVHIPAGKRGPLYALRHLFWNFLGVWPLVVLITLFAVAAVFSMVVASKSWGPRFCYRLYQIWAKSLLKGFGVRVWAQGVENLQGGPPGVISANHRSHFDIPVLGEVMKRPTVSVHKKSLELIPVLGQALWASGGVGIDRNDAVGTRERMTLVKQRLTEGRSVLMFPEGKRSKGPAMASFKKGAAMIAIEQQCNIYPVTILGTDVVYPPGNLMVHRGDVLIICHPPISTQGATAEDRDRITKELAAVVGGAFVAGPLDMEKAKGAVRLV